MNYNTHINICVLSQPIPISIIIIPMNHEIFYIMYNIKYLDNQDILYLKCVNLDALSAYKRSNICRYISANSLTKFIDYIGLNEYVMILLWRIPKPELLIYITELYNEDIFGEKYTSKYKTTITKTKFILNDPLYPKAWKYKSNVRALDILRLNKEIKNNKNVDAILNYANHPNKSYLNII